jgi:hypothetical protein
MMPLGTFVVGMVSMPTDGKGPGIPGIIGLALPAIIVCIGGVYDGLCSIIATG